MLFILDQQLNQKQRNEKLINKTHKNKRIECT